MKLKCFLGIVFASLHFFPIVNGRPTLPRFSKLLQFPENSPAMSRKWLNVLYIPGIFPLKTVLQINKKLKRYESWTVKKAEH